MIPGVGVGDWGGVGQGAQTTRYQWTSPGTNGQHGDHRRQYRVEHLKVTWRVDLAVVSTPTTERALWEVRGMLTSLTVVIISQSHRHIGHLKLGLVVCPLQLSRPGARSTQRDATMGPPVAPDRFVPVPPTWATVSPPGHDCHLGPNNSLLRGLCRLCRLVSSVLGLHPSGASHHPPPAPSSPDNEKRLRTLSNVS